MTDESWAGTPHASITYEASVKNLLGVLKEHNAAHADQHVTINSAMLKLIAEALGAAPKMNGHIRYHRRLISGRITLYDNVDVSVPVRFPSGLMIPVTLYGAEKMSMREIGAAMDDIMRRAANTNMEEAMFDVSIHDTFDELKHLHLVKAIGRLIGALIDHKRLRTLNRKERRQYRQIPENERLTRRDLKQGTITVSNVGAIYREWKGICTLLEIVPPQMACIAIGALRDNVITLTIAFDHRAMDVDDVFPLLRQMDELLASPDALRQMV